MADGNYTMPPLVYIKSLETEKAGYVARKGAATDKAVERMLDGRIAACDEQIAIHQARLDEHGNVRPAALEADTPTPAAG